MKIDSWLKITPDDGYDYGLLKPKLTVDNPEYMTRKKMGFKTTELQVQGKCPDCGKEVHETYQTRKDIPKECKRCLTPVKYLIDEVEMRRKDPLYKEVGHELWVPRALVHKYQGNNKLEDNTTMGDREVDFKSKIKLGPNEYTAMDQNHFVDELTKSLQNGYGSIGQSQAGSGKAQPLESLVLTTEGYKRMGDITVGDYAIDQYGKPTKVIGVYPQGIIETFKVSFNDGSSMECNDDHLFVIQSTHDHSTKTGKWRVMSLKELIDSGIYTPAGRRKWYIPITDPVQFEAKKVELDPYLLGCLLADGTFIHDHVLFSNSEEDILNRVKDLLPDDCELIYSNYGVDYRISRVSKRNPASRNGVRRLLTEVGLWGKKSYEKFIPHIYLYNTESVRYSLLQGLFDCDGTVSTNISKGGKKVSTLEYNTSSKQLAEDVAFLVQSFGGRVVVKSRIPFYTYKGERKAGRRSYRLYIVMPNHLQCFSSDKHSSRFGNRTKYGVCRSIISVEYVGKKEMQCISVENDSKTYLTNDCIVTHNTVMALEAISRLKRPAAILVHKEFLMNQWAERIMEFYNIKKEDIGFVQQDVCEYNNKKIVIIMLQSLLARDYPKSLFDYFGTICIDEVHRVAATEFRKAIVLFPARYRFGVTATPRRQDNLENVFFWHVGEIAVVGEQQGLKPEVKVVKTNINPTSMERNRFYDFRGKQNLNKVTDYLINSSQRNKLIVSLLVKALKADRKVLLLSGRLAHLENLKNMLELQMIKEGIRHTTGYYIGGMKEEERTISATRQCIFGTFAMAQEALDIQDLDSLFLTTPKSDIEQSTGRILRLMEGKKKPIVIDFSDEIEICIAMLKKRVNMYKDLGYMK